MLLIDDARRTFHNLSGQDFSAAAQPILRGGPASTAVELAIGLLAVCVPIPTTCGWFCRCDEATGEELTYPAAPEDPALDADDMRLALTSQWFFHVSRQRSQYGRR